MNDNKENDIIHLIIFLLACLAILTSLFPEYAIAQVGELEVKMRGLTKQIVTVILPLVSVLCLVYAVILALSGDASARGRIVTIIICSLIGFMAPQIIAWFQSAAGY